MIIENNKLTAEAGMILTNGEIYSEQVYLGIYDSPNNWHEIPEDEVPENPSEQEESQDDIQELAEAARILLGVSK